VKVLKRQNGSCVAVYGGT